MIGYCKLLYTKMKLSTPKCFSRLSWTKISHNSRAFLHSNLIGGGGGPLPTFSKMPDNDDRMAFSAFALSFMVRWFNNDRIKCKLSLLPIWKTASQ